MPRQLFDQKLGPQESKGPVSRLARSAVELLFSQREDEEGRETFIRIVEQEGIAGIGGEKGIHSQTYSVATREGGVDYITHKLISDLYRVIDRHRPVIKMRGGKPVMRGVELPDSGDAEYMRVILPFNSKYAGSVAESMGTPPATQDSWVFIDVPFTAARQVDPRDLATMDFLTQIQAYEGVYTEYKNWPTQNLESWHDFERDGRGAPLMVLRGKQVGREYDPLQEKQLEELNTDPRIGASVVVEHAHNSESETAFGRFSISAGHTMLDGAPIKRIIEAGMKEVAANYGKFEGDQLKGAELELTAICPARPLGAKAIKFAEVEQTRVLQEATIVGQGALALAKRLGVVEIRVRGELPEELVVWSKLINNQLQKRDGIMQSGEKVPMSLYYALAMRAVMGGAVYMPVSRGESSEQIELVVTPANLSGELVLLMEHLKQRMQYLLAPGRESEAQELAASFKPSFERTMQALDSVLKPFNEELAAAKEGEGSVSETVARLGAMRKIVEGVVGMQLAPELVEMLNASKMVSSLGGLKVPEGVVARGEFTTAGSANVDEPMGLMGNEGELRWFMNDSLGLFFVIGLMLKRRAVGFDEFIRAKTKDDKRLRGAAKIWNEYGVALDQSSMITGLVPEAMLPTYEQIMQNKKTRFAYQADADAFLTIFTDWLQTKQENNPGFTWSGGDDATKIEQALLPTLQAAAEYRQASFMYAVATYMVAVQMASEKDGFANWEENSREGERTRPLGTIDLHSGNLILDTLHKSLMEKMTRFNRLTAGLRVE